MPRSSKDQTSEINSTALRPRFQKSMAGDGKPCLEKLSVGSTVYYAGKGLFKVESRETLVLETSGNFVSWRLRSVSRGNDVVYVGAVALAKGGIRVVSPIKEFEVALQALSDSPQRMPVAWSRRREFLDNMLRSVSPADVANVARNTYGRARKDISLLSYGERALGDAALRLLAEEYALLHQVTPDNAFERLFKRVSTDPAIKLSKERSLRPGSTES